MRRRNGKRRTKKGYNSRKRRGIKIKVSRGGIRL